MSITRNKNGRRVRISTADPYRVKTLPQRRLSRVTVLEVVNLTKAAREVNFTGRETDKRQRGLPNVCQNVSCEQVTAAGYGRSREAIYRELKQERGPFQRFTTGPID